MQIHIVFILFFSFYSLLGMDSNQQYHETYKKRFPATRKSYKEYSNDDALFLYHFSQEIQRIKKDNPTFFTKNINIFVVGCHDGDISKSTIEILQQNGVKKISFRGIDQYKEHIDETKEKLKDFNLQERILSCECLETYKPTQQDKNFAHFILAAQICHHIKNINLFIEKLIQIAARKAVIIFGHTDDSTSTINQWFSKLIGSNKNLTMNLCPKIEGYFKSNNLEFQATKYIQNLALPKINARTLKLLRAIKARDYTNTYSNYSNEDQKIKNVLEFCATQPLEQLANSWFKLKLYTFLSALSLKAGKIIKLDYKIHTVYLRT